MIEPIQISPEALYDDGALPLNLGLTTATLVAARRWIAPSRPHR